MLILFLQILFHSLNKTYILTNLPWLIGSLGTMFEDATIFVQFRVFRRKAAKNNDDDADDGAAVE